MALSSAQKCEIFGDKQLDFGYGLSILTGALQSFTNVWKPYGMELERSEKWVFFDLVMHQPTRNRIF